VGEQTIVVTNQTKTLSKIAPIIDKNLILVSKTYISVENLIIDLDETGTIKTLKLFKDDILISDISNLNATSFNNLQKNSLYRVFLEFEFNLNEGDENKIIIFNDLVKTKFMEFGSGTTEDPFVITTVDDLIDVKYGLSSNYILANDLDLEGINWTPIGENFFSPFSGKFDGQGYNIDNLKISGTHNYVGLFGWNELGTITNLTLSNVDIDVTGSLDDDIMVGAFVGYNRGFVENLHTLSGKILAKKRADKIGYFGGLIGAHYYLDYIDSNNLHLINPMINLTNNLEVTGVGITNASTGGIVGHIYYGALVEDAINYGQISGDNNVGGIVGSISEYSGWARLTISNSENIGLISGISNVGGLVGNSPYGSRLLIKDSKNFSLIKASGNSTGGLVGFAYSLSILDSINHGNVIGSDYGTGGLLGYGSNGGATISRSKNFGDISGGRILGGLVGGGGIINITNSLNEGSVSGTDEIGGLAGGISSFTLNNSYNNSYIRGNYSVGGLAGRVYGNATIANSFNSGNLLGLDYVGGFIGRIDGSITLMTSYSTGLITGSAYVGGFIGRILGNFYAFNSINFSNVNAKNTNLNVGSILGGSPQTYDFELVYSTGFVFNNDSQISGYNLGNTQISLESIDENFFTNHLQWLDSIWNFSNIDSVNGFFPKII
jgi:hypothetical protein